MSDHAPASDPGRETDRLVAEALATKGVLLGDVGAREFSTCWDDAMWAAEKIGLFDDPRHLYLDHFPQVEETHREWRILEIDWYDGEEECFAAADTGAHSICLAILRIAREEAA